MVGAPIAYLDAQRGDLCQPFALSVIGSPSGVPGYVDPRRARLALRAIEAVPLQHLNDYFFKVLDVFLHEHAAATQVVKAVRHYLAGPVVGDLPAAITLHDVDRA